MKSLFLFFLLSPIYKPLFGQKTILFDENKPYYSIVTSKSSPSELIAAKLLRETLEKQTGYS